MSEQYKINVQTLYDEISANLETEPMKAEMLLALNKALKRMNSIMTPEKKIITVSGSQGATTIGDMTAAGTGETIGDMTDYTIGEYSRFGTNFVYDSNEYSLKIDDSISRVDYVILDDEVWENWPYDTVKDSNNADEKIYHFRGRKIYFPSDIGSSTEVIKLIVEMYYPEIEEGFVLVPKTYHSILVDGATYYLMMKPKHRDRTQYQTYFKNIKSEFFAQMEELERKNADMAPIEEATPAFIYQQYSKIND